MGQCFQALKRNYEAAAAYEKVFTLFPEDTNRREALLRGGALLTATEFAPSRATSGTTTQKEKFLSRAWRPTGPKDPAARNIKFVAGGKDGENERAT